MDSASPCFQTDRQSFVGSRNHRHHLALHPRPARLDRLAQALRFTEAQKRPVRPHAANQLN